MKASNHQIPLLEDEFEITGSTIKVFYYYEGDEEALPLTVDLESFQAYCEANNFLNLEYEEFNPTTQYSREWTTKISFEELIQDIDWRDYLRSRLFKYCFRILAQMENKTAA
jgi:hypothetical protein